MGLPDIGVKPYYSDKWREVYNGDSLGVLPAISSESIDLLVTDPPYGISFMGKHWDKALPDIEIWKQCLRVLKPGAFAFVMCIPRADCLSRMIISLEDAGFRVDFTPMYWTYAVGFPKAQNMGKAVDKRLGRLGVQGRGFNAAGDDGRKAELKQTLAFRSDYGYVHEHITPQAKALDGSYGGFQPKPAVEVIIVAMRPLSEKTFVDQALKNRKGITWLDACRVSYESEPPNIKSNRSGQGRNIYGGGDGIPVDNTLQDYNPSGRFPANLLVSDDALNSGQNSKGSHDQVFLTEKDSVFGCSGSQLGSNKGYGDSGSFSRYFDLDAWWEDRVKQLPESVQLTYPFLIVPKASKSEKNNGLGDALSRTNHGSTPRKNENENKSPNSHPTVKPLKLMSYLVTLGSRPGDVVLDPFVGSGTTLLACGSLDTYSIGIDSDEKSCEIAANRCAADSVARIKKGEY